MTSQQLTLLILTCKQLYCIDLSKKLNDKSSHKHVIVVFIVHGNKNSSTLCIVFQSCLGTDHKLRHNFFETVVTPASLKSKSCRVPRSKKRICSNYYRNETATSFFILRGIFHIESECKMRLSKADFLRKNRLLE